MVFGPRGYKLIQSMGMSAAMKDPYARFFAIEHLTGMLIAIILLHIWKGQGKKAITDRSKAPADLRFLSSRSFDHSTFHSMAIQTNSEWAVIGI
jgi:hypothetical protein